MVKAAIFDMDGVLVDSEPVYERCISEIMLRRGVALPSDFATDFFGVPSAKTFEYLVKKYDMDVPVETLLAEETAVMSERFRAGSIPVFPHAFALMRALRMHGYRIGVATSNFLENVESTLRNNDALPVVEAISSFETTAAFKPAPDVFLRTARLLGAEPVRCVVFEDSRAGVQGASAAGMRVVAFSPPGHIKLDLRLADRIIERFDEITAADIDALLDERTAEESAPRTRADAPRTN